MKKGNSWVCNSITYILLFKTSEYLVCGRSALCLTHFVIPSIKKTLVKGQYLMKLIILLLNQGKFYWPVFCLTVKVWWQKLQCLLMWLRAAASLQAPTTVSAPPEPTSAWRGQNILEPHKPPERLEKIKHKKRVLKDLTFSFYQKEAPEATYKAQ